MTKCSKKGVANALFSQGFTFAQRGTFSEIVSQIDEVTMHQKKLPLKFNRQMILT
jgi:hypothetical protein